MYTAGSVLLCIDVQQAMRSASNQKRVNSQVVLHQKDINDINGTIMR
jgi:hypothetical protein